jgi:organic radical activating enzyme
MNSLVTNLISGGIMTNYDCPAKCAHCRHNASPTRNGGFISQAMLEKILTKLEKLGCNSIHIEGGEPFLYPDKLIDAVKQINESALHLEHIVTNCSWYKNQKDTKSILKTLKAYGLGRLLVKVSPFQNESIPLRKMQNIAKVAEQLGINVMVWDNEVYPEVSSFDTSKTHSLKKYIKKYGADYMKKLAVCFNVTFAGRSFNVYEPFLNKYTIPDILKQNQGCSYDFPTAVHFHVDMYGNFVFSHTNGVTIHIDDIDKKFDPEKYPYLAILMNGGVESLYKLATSKYNFKPSTNGYISKCHLCYQLRK